MTNEEAGPGIDAAARSMRAMPATLSVAVREVKVRLARDDIHAALGPVSRDSEAALLSLELDDDEGLEHHLRRVVDGVRLAAMKYRELERLLRSPTPPAVPSEVAP
jgi:hypothetical protein